MNSIYPGNVKKQAALYNGYILGIPQNHGQIFIGKPEVETAVTNYIIFWQKVALDFCRLYLKKSCPNQKPIIVSLFTASIYNPITAQNVLFGTILKLI